MTTENPIVKIRYPYDPHERIQITFTEQTLTKQAMQDECDINQIVAKFEQTGLIDHQNENPGGYGDFTEVQDYQTSLNQVIAAKEMFEGLPAKIRGRFRNSPDEFLKFVDDPENREEMKSLGLVTPPEKPAETEEVEDEIVLTKAGAEAAAAAMAAEKANKKADKEAAEEQ